MIKIIDIYTSLFYSVLFKWWMVGRTYLISMILTSLFSKSAFKCRHRFAAKAEDVVEGDQGPAQPEDQTWRYEAGAGAGHWSGVTRGVDSASARARWHTGHTAHRRRARPWSRARHTYCTRTHHGHKIIQTKRLRQKICTYLNIIWVNNSTVAFSSLDTFNCILNLYFALLKLKCLSISYLQSVSTFCKTSLWVQSKHNVTRHVWYFVGHRLVWCHCHWWLCASYQRLQWRWWCRCRPVSGDMWGEGTGDQASSVQPCVQPRAQPQVQEASAHLARWWPGVWRLAWTRPVLPGLQARAQLSQAGPGGWWPGQHWSPCHCTATTNLYFYFPWSQDNLAAGQDRQWAVSCERIWCPSQDNP